jgi:hypothetical protein
MPVIDQLLSLEGSIRIDEKSGFGCVKSCWSRPWRFAMKRRLI